MVFGGWCRCCTGLARKMARCPVLLLALVHCGSGTPLLPRPRAGPRTPSASALAVSPTRTPTLHKAAGAVSAHTPLEHVLGALKIGHDPPRTTQREHEVRPRSRAPGAHPLPAWTCCHGRDVHTVFRDTWLSQATLCAPGARNTFTPPLPAPPRSAELTMTVCNVSLALELHRVGSGGSRAGSQPRRSSQRPQTRL